MAGRWLAVIEGAVAAAVTILAVMAPAGAGRVAPEDPLLPQKTAWYGWVQEHGFSDPSVGLQVVLTTCEAIGVRGDAGRASWGVLEASRDKFPDVYELIVRGLWAWCPEALGDPQELTVSSP